MGQFVELTTDTDSPFDCGNGTLSTGALTFDPLPFGHDEDGDGCTDWYELGENPDLGGLNDPFNPTDCDGLPGMADELTPDGLYEISHEMAGGYRRCMGAVEEAPLEMRVYCYWDHPQIPINPEAYPGVYGDGLPGAPPPGPDIGGGNYVYGDVDGAHTVLTGSVLGGSLVQFTGCFQDQDGEDPLGHVYVSWIFNAQTGAGGSSTWTGQCSASGGADSGTLQAMKLATTAQMDACYSTPGVCPFADNDPASYDRNGDGVVDKNDAGDGVPDHRELEDDALCGRRDPFNVNDYYDVGTSGSTALDSVIDLPNDILGVQLHFAPGGYPPGWENWDRPPTMANAQGGSWNRGSPDGVIDLPNDIVGVTLQFNPGGCPGSG